MLPNTECLLPHTYMQLYSLDFKSQNPGHKTLALTTPTQSKHIQIVIGASIKIFYFCKLYIHLESRSHIDVYIHTHTHTHTHKLYRRADLVFLPIRVITNTVIRSSRTPTLVSTFIPVKKTRTQLLGTYVSDIINGSIPAFFLSCAGC